jgi:3-hydroxyisobutyrate dehydrogenase-like beta-hydroxyacid dehydrogenase
MAKERGITYLDCPVSGGVGGAKAGTLTIMAGGPGQAVERLMPVFEVIGKNIHHIGDIGTGAGIKMINNFILGCNMAAVAEALVLGTKLGLNLDTMYEIIKTSSGRSFIIENKIPNFIKKRSFTGGFTVDLEYKDLGLALETAKQLAMPIPMGSTAAQVFETARAKGLGKEDITALIKIWEELMGVEVR